MTRWTAGLAPGVLLIVTSQLLAAGPAAGEGQQPPAHPLTPVLQHVNHALEQIDTKYRDYTCTLVKRERVDGKLRGPDYVQVKIRHRPFSVYTRYLHPEEYQGQEAIYVEGRNNGKLLAHGVGLEKLLGTFSLDPTGSLAMEGQRFPITDAGMRNLLAKFSRRCQLEMQYGECEVQFYQGAKVDDRECLLAEVRHPHPRRTFRYSLARLYFDTQLRIPLRFEGYTWPQRAGGPPELVEEYTYTGLKLNQRLTDQDFSTDNPAYDY